MKGNVMKTVAGGGNLLLEVGKSYRTEGGTVVNILKVGKIFATGEFTGHNVPNSYWFKNGQKDLGHHHLDLIEKVE
jgi:hypothetical protein